MEAPPTLFDTLPESNAETDAQEIQLYDWQDVAVESLRRGIRDRKKNQVLAAPTGSGKTVIGSHLLKECYQKGNRGIFVCDRIPLVDQTSRTFDRYGIPHGVQQGDHWRDQPWQRIQIASAQTLLSRGWPERVDLIVVDECHTMYQTVKDTISKREAITIGLTATPFSPGMGRFYDGVVTVRTTNELIRDGYLAPYRVFAATEPDMTGAKVAAGEWTNSEASSRSMPIVGDVVSEYLKNGEDKKFICFGVDVAHCEELHRQFMAAGVLCGLYTYRNLAEREMLLEDFAKRDSRIRGLISVSALAKGFDNPQVEVVIVARPLRKSLAEHIQMIGRGLRRDPENPGKVCTILDHAGNTVRFWADMMDFFENGATKLDDGKRKKKSEPKSVEKEPLKCPNCTNVHDRAPSCPRCGFVYPKKRSEVVTVAGTLNELTGLPAGSVEDKQAFYSQLLGVAAERGYAEGWAAHNYRSRFGVWPRGLDKIPTEPTRKTRSWIRKKHIAFAKGNG